tara:strand:- start:213 stop:497 length:285 start_codon:yes stop_codon:yes gene_type:complete
MLDDVTIVVWIDVPLSDEEAINIISNGVATNTEVIITESRLMIMFKTESLADAIALLSSTNLVNSVVKVKKIREIDISNVIDPNKYETLFEPEV